MSEESPRPTDLELWRRARNSLALATAASAGVVYVDTKWLLELDVEPSQAIGIAAGACALVVVLSALVASAVGRILAPWVSTTWAQAKQRPQQVGAKLIVGIIFCVALTLTAWGGVYLAEIWFASATVRRMAVALLVLSAAVLTAVTGGPSQVAVARLLGAKSSRTLLTLSAFVVLSLFIAAGVWQLIPIAQQMELRAPMHASGIAGAGLLGWALPGITLRFRRGRRVWRGLSAGLLAAAVLMLGLGAWASTTTRDDRLELALQLRPIMSSKVFQAVHGSAAPFLMPARPARDRSAICTPGANPPRAADVGTVGTEAPDIVFVTVDALRWDMMSLAGRKRDTTPQLAKHGDHGVIFERAYTPAPITRQAFRGLFTGVRPSLVHPVRPTRSRFGFGFVDAQVTLAEYLDHAGYETIALSTASTIFTRRDGALDGFEVVDDEPYRLCKTRKYCTDYVVDEIIATLRREQDAPRFMWTHLMEAHGPYHGGPDPKDFGDTFQDEYDSALHFIDGELGRLLDFARSPERRDRTWVVVTADHGEGLRHPRKHTGHGMHVHEEEIRVPLLVWGPGTSPRRVTQPVSLLNVMPSVVDMAGLRVPKGLCGSTLLPVLGGAPVAPGPVVSEFVPDFGRSQFMAAFIRGSTKTIVRPLDQRSELYFLDQDPNELNDLAVSQPDVLQRELEAFKVYLTERGIDPSSYRL